MKHNTYSWNSADGIPFFGQAWQPDSDPKALIIHLHGLGEHGARYEHVAAALTGAGFVLASCDLRGHGKTGGQRGHFPSLEIVMRDIERHVQEAVQRFPSLPLFLYGHSMGGIFALSYPTYIKTPFQGVIATSPGLRSSLEEQPFKLALVKILGKLAPRMSMATGLDANFLSHDPQVLQRYTSDPLVHGVATLSLGNVLLAGIDWAYKHARAFPAPLLLMHGSADPITYPSGSQEFSELVPGPCTLKIWEGMYHETHNETDQAAVFSFLTQWLEGALLSAR